MPVVVDGRSVDSDAGGFEESIGELVIGSAGRIVDHLPQQGLLLGCELLGSAVVAGSRLQTPMLSVQLEPVVNRVLVHLEPLGKAHDATFTSLIGTNHTLPKIL